MMKRTLHVDIQDQDGVDHCLTHENGTFMLALRTLWVLYRAGGGSITINPIEEEV